MAELPHGTAPRVKSSPMLALPFLASALACGVMALAARPAAAAAAPAAYAPSDSLTIAQCVSLARERAPEVRARATELTGARFDSTGASKNRRPALGFTSGLVAAPDGYYDPALTNLGEYGARLEVTVPLTDGGERRREREQASAGLLSSVAERDLAARDAGFRAAALAVDLLRHQEMEATNREMMTWLERFSELVASSVKGGARPRSDAVRAQLERDGLEAEILSAAAESDALARELAQLVGRAAGERVAVLEPEPVLETMPSDADSLALVQADERAPEVRSAIADVAHERVALDQAKRRNSWHVDLAADAGLWGSNTTQWIPDDLRAENPGSTFGDRLRRDLGASLSLQFHRPLFDPTTGYAVQGEESRLQAAELRQEAALADRRRETLDLLARWRSAAARAALARESLQRASDNLVRMRSLYAGGASSLLELLDALGQWDDARDRLADARLDARLAHWEGEIRR